MKKEWREWDKTERQEKEKRERWERKEGWEEREEEKGKRGKFRSHSSFQKSVPKGPVSAMGPAPRWQMTGLFVSPLSHSLNDAFLSQWQRTPTRDMRGRQFCHCN